MKLGNRMPVDVGVVLVAGLTMALSGCTPSALTVAAFSAPAAAASAPRPVGAHSAPTAQTVADRSVPVSVPGSLTGSVPANVPVSAYSAPVVRCVDVPTSAVRTIGASSVPHCVVFDPRRATVADYSVPAAAARVADSSAPHCVEIVRPTTTIRRC
jgi:hypothetical protein